MPNRRRFLRLSAGALTAAAARPLFGAGSRAPTTGSGWRSSAAETASGARVRLARAPRRLPVPRRRGGEQGQARSVDDARAPDVQPRGRRRLPPDSRSPGHRRGAHRHARSLARAADDRCDRRRQGRLRREAGVEHHPAHQRDARRLQEGEAGRPDRHAAAQLGSLHRGEESLDSGVLGKVTHIYIVQPGSTRAREEAEQPVPAGLDWDMWQGPAPRKPFKPTRLAFRGWYDYGGGLVADWGAHHVDVAHWFMNADHKAPVRTTAVGSFLAVPDADPEQVPDTFSISWQYDNFLMTFANGEVARAQDDIEGWGVFFVGNRGSLQVNRMGWAVRPNVPRTGASRGRRRRHGGVTLGAAARPGGRARRAEGAAAAGRRESSAGRAQTCTSTRRAASRKTIRSTRTRGTSSTASSRARSRRPTWRSATTPRSRACSRSSR